MSHFRLIAGGFALSWLALVVWTPLPVNPVVNVAIGLEANRPVPASIGPLLRRACFDCHSDETRWPWYSRVPPASWLLSHDVTEGRGQINFSRWTDYNAFDRADMLDKMCDLTTKGKMPLWQYRIAHAEARLTTADTTALCAWTRLESTRLVQAGAE